MNWVGGVRNRLKTSLQSDRNVQKMYLERKHQERASTASVSRHPSDVTISKPRRQRKKHSVSQDVLSFKMQSEINYKNDISNGRNFRVVNLGPTKQMQVIKNGVNGVRTRRVESVNLPVSPIETPSVLNLSNSPASCCYKKLPDCTSQENVEPVLREIMPYNWCTDSKKTSLCENMPNSSTLINLFGMPMEKPLRNQKPASAAELKHNYSVKSGRACRKHSCTMESCGLAPAPSDMRQVGYIQMSSTTDTRNMNIIAPNNFESLPFANSTALNQKSSPSFTFSSNNDASSRLQCSSEPVINNSSGALSNEQWLSTTVTGYSAHQDMRYISSFPDIQPAPVPDTSDAAFFTERHFDAFQVNIVNSPHCKKNDNITENQSNEYRIQNQTCLLQTGSNVEQHLSKVNNSIANPKNYAVNMRSSTIESVPFTDSLNADAEFYEEVNKNKLEEIIFASSPHSPAKPIFLSHSGNYYSPQSNRNQLSEQSVYDRSNYSLKCGQSLAPFHLRDFSEPLTQQRPDGKEVYNAGSTIQAQSSVSCDSNRNDYFCRESEQCVRDAHSHKDQQYDFHSRQTYVVSSGLDCTPNEGPVDHSRHRSTESMVILPWHQTLEHTKSEASNRGRRASTSSSSNEKTTFMPKKLVPYFSRANRGTVAGSELTTLYNRQGSLKAARSTSSHDSQSQEKKINQHNIDQLTESEWLSGVNNYTLLPTNPVMTSTPFSPAITETSSTHNYQLLLAEQTKHHRESNKTSSASEVLLEMSILEKQRWSQTLVGRSTPATSARVSDLESTPQISPKTNAAQETSQHSYTYLTDSLKKPPELTTVSFHEQTAAGANHVPTSSSNVTASILSTPHADNTVLYTPAQSISSAETRVKSPLSARLVADNQAPVLDYQDICPDNSIQNNGYQVTFERELDMDSAECLDDGVKVVASRLSTDNRDRFPSGETGVGSSSPVAKLACARKHMVSTGSQTIPNHFRDAACSPIKVFSKDGPRLLLDRATSNDADTHNSKIYCLRPRNKVE